MKKTESDPADIDQRFRKHFIRFARKSGDQVGADRNTGDSFLDFCDSLFVLRQGVRSAHAF